MSNELNDVARWALIGGAMRDGDDHLLDELIGKRNTDAMKVILQNFEALCKEIDADMDAVQAKKTHGKSCEIIGGLFTRPELAITSPQRPRRQRRFRRNSSYAVRNEELLYKIADAGLLCKLHGVTNERTKTYYFDRDPEIKEIFDAFLLENSEAKERF